MDSEQDIINDHKTAAPAHLTLFILEPHTFFKNIFKKNLSGTLSECQTVWIQIRTDAVGPDLGPNCLQRLSADDLCHCLQGKLNLQTFSYSLSSLRCTIRLNIS